MDENRRAGEEAEEWTEHAKTHSRLVEGVNHSFYA